MRAILLAPAIAALAVLAGFFADHPGAVAIRWQDWRVETSVGVLIGATILAALALAVFLVALRALIRTPRRWLAARRERRRREGYRALWEGLVAVAAGDPREAVRLARRAELLLAAAPPSLFLRAQAAELEGDAIAAKRYWTAMLERPETELFGLRALFRKALDEGDREAAKNFARRARALTPGAPWVWASLFALETRDGRWEEAERTLGEASARQAFPPERARHYRGVLLYELSREAEKAGDPRRALALAASAEAFCRDLAAPAAHHARLLLEEGRAKGAARIVENAWRTAPHPELARLYGTIFAAEPALERVKRFERLAAQNPEARESQIALAEAAMAAGLWGQARRSLEKALAAALPPTPVPSAERSPSSPDAAGPAGDIHSAGAASLDQTPVQQGSAGATQQLCLLMARLEEAEYGDERQAREWRERALAAAPDPVYVCADCRGESLEWHALCPFCGAFDRLTWRTPRHAPAPPPPPLAAISAPISLPQARRAGRGNLAEGAKRLGGASGTG